MEFTLQISDFSWLMSCISINRTGKDRYGRRFSREEGMRKRKVKRNEKKKNRYPGSKSFLDVHETISVHKNTNLRPRAKICISKAPI